MKFRTLILAAVLLFAGCDNEDDENKLLLTVRVGDSPNPNGLTFQKWMYLTNEKQEVLALERFDKNSTVNLYSSKRAGTLTLTFFMQSEGMEDDYYSFNSFTGVEAGSTVSIDYFPTGIPGSQYEGDAYVTISNYEESEIPQGAIAFSTHSSATNGFDLLRWEENTVVAKIPLYRNPSPMFIAAYRDNKPVYLSVDRVQKDESVEVDFADFEETPEVVDVPNMSGYTGGWKNETLHTISSTDLQLHTHGDNVSELKIGYVPGFEHYVTSITGGNFSEHFRYYKVGAPITSFTRPQYDVEVVHGYLTNFEIETNFDYDVLNASWFTNNDPAVRDKLLFWSAHTTDKIALGAIPAELKILFPFLKSVDVTELTFTGGTMQKSLVGDAYPLFEPYNLSVTEPQESLQLHFSR